MVYILLLPIFLIWSFLLSKIAQHLTDCKKKSLLFPYFEIILAFCFLAIWHNNYFYSYFILFSALGITIQTDFCCMLISRFVSLYLLPIPIALSIGGFLPIHVIDSVIASFIGYGLFYIINRTFRFFTHQDGIGQGDLDLMALIGAYTGMIGIWFTILSGSILGSISAFGYMLYTKQRVLHIPFGPFLSIGSIIFILFQQHILYFFL